MANFCYYDVRIRGRRSHALLLCNSLPTLDGGSVNFARGNDEEYEIHFHAACKWSLEAYVKSEWNGKEIPANLDSLSEDDLLDLGMKCMWYSLREKSRVLKCVVMAHSWSDESDFDCFEHYDNGECIDYNNDEYDPEYVFDWDQMDYVLKSGIPQPVPYAERIKALWDAKLPGLKAAVPFDHIRSISCQGKKFVLTGLSEYLAFDVLGIKASNPTGTLPTRWWIEENGGVCGKRVTMQTDYLIVGINANPASRMIETAVRYRDSGSAQIRILSEDDLLRMLNGETLEIPVEYQLELQARQNAIEKVRLEKQQMEVEAARQREAQREAAAQERRARKEAADALLAEAKKEKAAMREAHSLQKAAEKEEKRRLEHEERERKIANDVLYRPGMEPGYIRSRMETLFGKLNGAYPDKIISALPAEHKKWNEAVNEIRKQLGYPDSQAFLEAYGYTYVSNKGGRPSTVDPEAVIEELKRRYSDGAYITVAQLQKENGDLPIKTLVNNAQKFFGMSLGDYLKHVGILKKK